jgi:Zn finger protein HypA/HybF involved in hydrogenase expression
MIRMTLNTSTALQYAMPIISKKKYTFWCQDCNAVFNELTKANEHQEK